MHLSLPSIHIRGDDYETFATNCRRTYRRQSSNDRTKWRVIVKNVSPVLFFFQNAAHDAAASSRRTENSSTVANIGNLVSPSLDKAPSPHKPKVKLPIGVLPIPEIREDEKKPEETEKRDDSAHNPPPRFVPDSKEKEPVVEAGNLDPPFVANPPARHVGEQIERRANDGWFKVGPGVQEVGEEPNRVPG